MMIFRSCLERAVIVAPTDISVMVSTMALRNRRQPEQQPAEQIPNGLRGVVSHGGHHGEAARCPEHLIANALRSAL